MAVGEADRVEQFRGLGPVRTTEAGRQLDLLVGPEVGDQVVGWILEHDAEPAPTQPAPLPGPQAK